MTIPDAFQTAFRHHQSGQLAEAEVIYRQILAVDPRHADALHLLGVVAHQVGRNDVALELILHAIVSNPSAPVFHSNLGEVYRKLGRLDEAIGACRQAIQLQPEIAEAHNNLGNTLRDQGHLGDAVAVYHRAIQIKPEYAAAHNNLGNALRDLGRLDEAVVAYRRALQLQPEYADAHNNLGAALSNQGYVEEALAAYQRAIQIEPECVEAKWNSSHLLLLRGDFVSGWPLFEARWDAEDHKLWKRNLPHPLWKGEPLTGQRVLIYAEQGLGDTLQFVRYAPLVAQRGGHVIVECQPGLQTLLRSLAGVTQIIGCGEPLPAFDLHCPLMSLPLAFGTRVESIPAAIPYLRADAKKVARWRKRLEQEQGLAGEGNPARCRALKIGLAWAGGERPHQPKLRPVDQRRSLRLSQFAPLAGVPGVVFVSLQKGEPAKQAQTPPEGMRLLDWTDELEDFADTAALVECLDLVISVDTAVAHLAGALGKPVWLLNRFDTCWRWLLERADSPWYPTMRLFRQPRFMDWEPVMADVRKQLELLVGWQRSTDFNSS